METLYNLEQELEKIQITLVKSTYSGSQAINSKCGNIHRVRLETTLSTNLGTQAKEHIRHIKKQAIRVVNLLNYFYYNT